MLEAIRSATASRWADIALALMLTVLALWESGSTATSSSVDMVSSLLLVVQTGAVALRRSQTLLAVLLSVGALLCEVAFATASNTLAGLVAGLVITYSVGRHLGGRALIVASLVIAAGLAVHVMALPSATMADYAFTALFSGVAWVIGRGARTRARERSAAEREALLTSAGHEARVAAAVAEERARIAREMHDVVAHGMSVMVVQAAAAEHMLASDPERAREPLATVRHTGQESLAEMRRLLGLLRADEDAASDRSPQPTLDQLPVLVARLHDAGMPVTLHVVGPDIDVPPGLGLCAYRIAQEALTNSLKHAAGATTTVVLRRTLDSVVVSVGNDPPPTGAPSPPALPGALHGIKGMRERVALYGGTLTAAPTPDGGFLVEATLPLPQ